jgi:hypothetical protein
MGIVGTSILACPSGPHRPPPSPTGTWALQLPRPRTSPKNEGIWRSLGRAGFDIVPTMPNRLRFTLRTMSNRATPAAHRPGAPLHARKQAAGVPSAGSQPFNHPPRDPADGATLGSLPAGGDSEGRHSGKPRSRSPSATSGSDHGRGSTPPLRRHPGTYSFRAVLWCDSGPKGQKSDAPRKNAPRSPAGRLSDSFL